MSKLIFYGGAKIVTGANYLLEVNGLKILVDCGLFQGSRFAETLNYEPFPYDPKEIDMVLITHSHADHIGRLPKLYKEGFRNKVYATRPTFDLIKFALPDSLGLIEHEATSDNHEPLFSGEDIDEVLELFKPVFYDEPLDVGKGVKIIFHDAGHILGSSIIEINWETNTDKERIYFTGDLGNVSNPLLNPPFNAHDADYVVIESAYGSRVHEDIYEKKNMLEDVIEETVVKGGTVIIPSFAMERTQELLYEINELLTNKRIPNIPVYLDSPLAVELTSVYRNSYRYFNPKAKENLEKWGGLFKFKNLIISNSTDDSKKINDIKGSKIIIAGSGMSNGGRILHHEIRYLPDPNSAIVFIGYQVAGSLGRKIFDGEKEVSILGQKVQVNCRVEAIGGYSAHADQNGLLDWVKRAGQSNKLKKVFIVQGEEDSSLALAQRMIDEMAINAIVPNLKESFEL